MGDTPKVMSYGDTPKVMSYGDTHIVRSYSDAISKISLRPPGGKLTHFNRINLPQFDVNDFVFNIVRPWESIRHWTIVTMHNIICVDGIYYAYLSDEIKNKHNVDDIQLALNIFSDNFTLYLDEFQLNLECEIINDNPVDFYVEYTSQREYECEELIRLIEIKLFNLGKYIKKLKNPKYGENAMRILKEEKTIKELDVYYQEMRRYELDKVGSNVDDYYLDDYCEAEFY